MRWEDLRPGPMGAEDGTQPPPPPVNTEPPAGSAPRPTPVGNKPAAGLALADDRPTPAGAEPAPSGAAAAVSKPRRARKASAQQPVRLEADQALSPAVQTVSLGLAVLREAGVRTWADLGAGLEAWPGRVRLEPEQLETMHQHSHLLGFIAQARQGQKEPTVTLVICPTCSRFELTTGASSKTCHLTLGCTGKPEKARAAKSVPVDEPLDQPA